MNKRYCIDIKETSCEPKKKEVPKSDSTLLVLFLAIVFGILISPDQIDIRDYIPKEYHHENSNSF